MSRAHRLLDLVQLLRRYRRPVQGAVLAAELGISIRTLYRDIATLKGQGADIQGEAGLGFVLRPGFMLPPLMFSEEEIEALVLGSRWVWARADGPLAQAARDVLSKIGAVLPDDLHDGLERSGLLIGPGAPIATGDWVSKAIREAIRSETKLRIVYADEKAETTERSIWPAALGFYDRARVLVAWCELREAFRHFRTDRIVSLEATSERYPRRRASLLKTWRDQRGLPEQ